MQATAQQQAIISESRHKNVVVKGRAGCAKTSVIEMVCRDQMYKNVLLVCFNKDIRVAAEARMPANVTCKTFHQLAWPTYGKYFDARMKLRFIPNVIAKKLGIEPELANAVKYTIRRFTSSDDRVITGFHVPYESYVKMTKEEQNAFKEEVVTAARKLWTMKCDFKAKDIVVEFDDWLKMFELEGRVRGQFDMVINDEGQDTTRRDMSIMSKLQCQKMFAGDDFQQLYSWRGSINSLDEVGIQNEMFLTQSFRFGEALAEKANQVLALLNHNTPPLQGLSSIPSEISWDNRPTERHTIICRTNAGLLDSALNAIRRDKMIHIVGNMAETIRLLESAWYLSIGETRKVTHPEMSLMGDWNVVTELAKTDTDLKSLVKQVEKYSGNIPSLCDELKTAGEYPAHKADIIISTVHKSKGLEYDVVKLAEDFPEELIKFDHRTRKYLAKKDEVYCLYVAVTRAKLKLYMNSTMSQLANWKEMVS